MSNGLIYKIISKKRISDLNSGELPEDAVFEALKVGEFNHARCEDFRLTSWGTEDIHVKHFSWKRGKFRGEFTNCIFSDGEMHDVDFWDSDFKNVTFRNIVFMEGEINSFYSKNFLFELDNIIFDNCIFHEFTIGQMLNSNVFFKNCQMTESNFYMKSSCLTFYKCSTKKEKTRKSICVRIFDSKNIEPVKIKECSSFGLYLIGYELDILNISAKNIYIKIDCNIKIKNFIIHCNRFDLDTTCHTTEQVDEAKRLYEAGLPLTRIMENVEIVCSGGGVFGILGFKINTLKLAMTEERPKSESAICYCQINNFEAVGFKSDGLMITETTIHKTNFRSCHFNELELSECIIPDLTLNSVKIANKMILNKTKIGHLSLDRVSIDKKVSWESELSTIAVLDKPEFTQKDIKNVSGQRLQTYFERTDVGPLK
jgi:uncharacterized protein YjbI with pentapeptide repeats